MCLQSHSSPLESHEGRTWLLVLRLWKKKHGGPPDWPSRAHQGFSWGNTLGQRSSCPGPRLIEVSYVYFGAGTRERVRFQLLLWPTHCWDCQSSIRPESWESVTWGWGSLSEHPRGRGKWGIDISKSSGEILEAMKTNPQNDLPSRTATPWDVLLDPSFYLVLLFSCIYLLCCVETSPTGHSLISEPVFIFLLHTASLSYPRTPSLTSHPCRQEAGKVGSNGYWRQKWL